MNNKLGWMLPVIVLLVACSGGGSGPGDPSGNANAVYDTLLTAHVTTLRSIASYDIDNDGNMDILAYRYDLPSASDLYFGNGNGSFVDNGETYIGGARSLAFGDLDNDNIPDIVTGTHSSVGIYQGDGSGKFTGVGGTFLLADQDSLVVDDFDHDGNLDVAATSAAYPDGFSVMLGNGDGTLQSDVHYEIESLSSIAKGDFDQDGNIDLVVTGLYTADILIEMGNNDGTFQSSIRVATGDGSVNTQNRSVTTGDINGDSALDIIVGKMFGKQFSVLLNDGEGNFTLSIVTTTNIPAKVIIADMDGDGNMDVVSANPSSGANIYIQKGNGDGTFVNDYTLSTGSIVSDFTVADFNRDGKPDIAAVVNQAEAVVAVYMNGGNYTY